MRQLLIHDTRSVGFLTAVVLARVLTRHGNSITVYFDRRLTRHAQEFWPNAAPALDLRPYDQVVLCCMTFDDIDPDRCLAQLRRFAEHTGNPPMILSHRWPDGYERAGYQVIVPPFDLLESYAGELEPAERDLLRLSLIISRQADPALVSSEDFDVGERLGTASWQDFESYWARLLANPTSVLQELRSDPHLGRSTPAVAKGTIEASNEKYAIFSLDPAMRGHAEKYVEALLRTISQGPPLGIGILNDQGDVRVHLVRPWGSSLPSIEYLLESFAEQHDLPAARHWFGPQDAKTLRFKHAALDDSRLPGLKANLLKFADFSHGIQHGERRPAAGLARVIHIAATNALRSLDLLQLYTHDRNPSLRFDPLKLRLLIEPSNRTGELRSTLVMRLLVTSPEAAAFVYQHEGYNFMKLERLLEGVVIGMGTQRSVWLGALRVPNRLRVDARVLPEVMPEVSRVMSDRPEVRPVSLGEAVERGILTETSSIYKALERYMPAGHQQVIVYRDSETIGPSVPYALAVGAMAEVLGMVKGRALDVIDLFSGSALSARVVLNKQDSWHVYCVDSAISASQAGLGSYRNVVWLKTDVRKVLSGEEGVLHRQFDLAAMDPPHGSLFDILFSPARGSETLIDALSRIAPWLLVYQGHASQVGRAMAVETAMHGRYQRAKLWQLGPEVIAIAGPEVWFGSDFTELIGKAEDLLRREAERYGWALETRMAWVRSAV